MKRISAWTKNNIREIRHTLGRYLAILTIIALGTGFFSGLSVTKEAMLRTGNQYVNDDSNMYDFRLMSTIGFTEEDEDFFKQMDEVRYAEATFSIDFLAEVNNYRSFEMSGDQSDVVLKAYAFTEDINKVRLLSGRMPESPNECIVDALAFKDDTIGTTIKILSKNADSTIDCFMYEEYEIVGRCCTVNFLNMQRGTTTLEGGTLNGFIFIPNEGMNIERYTEMLIRLDTDEEIFTDEYDEAIEGFTDSISSALEELAESNYDEYISTASSEIDDAEEQYQEGYEEYITKRDDAIQQLDEALETLEIAKAEIEAGRLELEEALAQITEGEAQYDRGLGEYNRGRAEFESTKASVLAQLQQAQDEIAENRLRAEVALEILGSGTIGEMLEQYYATIERMAELQAFMDGIEDHFSIEYIAAYLEYLYLQSQIAVIEQSGIIEQYEQLLDAIEQIDAAQAMLDEQRSAAEAELRQAEAELNSARRQLNALRGQLDDAREQYDEGVITLQQAEIDYADGLTEYEQAKEEVYAELESAEAGLKDARQIIDDAKADLNELKNTSVATFTFDRSANSSYAGFESDSSIVEGISRVLPVFFFLVAALVCTTTMTRMVDEQRTHIGTLKALGYGNGRIVMKYISYSGSAAAIGCVIGYVGGSCLFPYSIWQAYKMLYNFGEIQLVFDPMYALLSVVVAMLCTVGATYLACKTELAQMPAMLMRPKAPVAGKRVFLERIGFIWKHMSFFHKVTSRNILRYKRRLVMMLLGVGGCTALVLTCFGVRDSISNIASDQFGNIMKYDFIVSFADPLSQEDMNKFSEDTDDMLAECVFVISDTVEVVNDSKTINTNIIATDDMKINEIIGFSLDGEAVSYPDDNGIIINDKLADLVGISVGDKLTIRLNEFDTIELYVQGVFENYVYNYIFMTGELYESTMSGRGSYKNALASAETGEDASSISASLINDHGVAAATVIDEIEATVSDMMNSLNYIVGLVSICACALAFVVAYNLSNINITERVREIATLKVLGLNSRETNAYVFRENFVLTAIGAVLGLPFGALLHRFVMSQIKIEMVSFNVRILPLSYVIAFGVAILLTLLVDIILRGKIAKISMAESLKSVE